ncbi:MAG: hypothetical protein J6S43_03055 [Lentisphaeria bacterium]|nr:hypothetical protein [Lentisphaeria bacterium]
MKKWMRPTGETAGQAAMLRNRMCAAGNVKFKFQYSADRFCSVFIDGDLISHGPELGAPEHWYYQTVECDLAPGEHIIDVRLCIFDQKHAPFRSVSKTPGFYFENLSDVQLGRWQYISLDGEFKRSSWDWGGVPKITASLPEIPDAAKWQDVEYFDDDRELYAPDLPACLQGEINSFTRQDKPGRTIICFDGYECFIGVYRFRGRGKVKISHAETPYLDERCYMYYLKGNKGERDGKVFHCDPNCFDIDGEVQWSDYTWISGRYVIIEYDGSVEISGLSFRKWGYPLAEPDYREADGEYRKLLKKSFVTLQNCSHDIYLDCPYFDQLMYSGDSLTEMVATIAVDPECRLPEKMLRFFAMSQNPDGSIVARYPCSDPELNGGIPSYTAYFLLSYYYFACWKNNRELVNELLPAAEKAAQYIISGIDKDGLWQPGRWMLLDWVSCWHDGIPTGNRCNECNSEMNLLAALALQKLSEVEKFAGKAEYAGTLEKYARILTESAYRHFFNEKRGMLANDLEKKFYAEHSQVLALLLQRDERIIHALHCEELPSCGALFSFFYLEACYIQDLPELFTRKIREWMERASHGLKTLPEEFGNPRSDCHGWGAHLLYHHYASVLGMRPDGPGEKICQHRKLKLGNL